MPDSILTWNAVALETLRRSYDHREVEQPGPVLGARALAITHLAMHDAYFGVTDPAHPRYSSLTLPTPAPTEAGEAVAAAAYTALSRLYPAQQPALQALLEALGDPSPLNASHGFGVQAAEAILNNRADDPRVDTPYVLKTGPGKHRVDPDNPEQGFYASRYGEKAGLFAATQRFMLAEPPFGTDARYVRALREVRSKGIEPGRLASVPSSRRRTPHETLTGLFWAYDGAKRLGTPPRLYNQIVRRVAQARGNTEAVNAQLFALVNVALADAGTLAWREKYRHEFWRPVVGIREHDPSMGPAATEGTDTLRPDCDPQWLPLGAPSTNKASFHATEDGMVEVRKDFTPQFPAYPSGHATFGAAALHMTRLFYGEGGRYSDGQGRVTGTPHFTDSLFGNLTFVSDECDGVNVDLHGTVRPRHVRSFPRGLWDMIEENGRSRVYLGVHWVFDAFLTDASGALDLTETDAQGRPYGGVPLGLMIAENIFDAAGTPRSPRPSPLPVP